GICATSIRPIKHNLPTVWRNGGADFTQPQGGRLLREPLCVTEHETSPLVWSQAIHWRVDPQAPTRQEHQPAMRDLSTQDVVLHFSQDIALTKLRYRCVALNRQIRLEPCQQPGGHSDRSPLFPLREPGTQQKRKLPLAELGRLDGISDLGDQQRASFLEPHSGGDEKFGEQGVPQAVTAAPTDPDPAIDLKSQQTDISKAMKVIEHEKASVRGLDSAFIRGVRCNYRTWPAAM